MLEDIRARHKQDEVEFNKVSKGLVHQDRGELLSLIDKYKEALNECKAYDIKANCNFCGGGITEIVNSALEKD